MITKQKNLKVEPVYQERLQHLANIALDVVETVLIDMEAPINLRLDAAFKIFELRNISPKNNDDDVSQTIIRGIERNANELIYLESLMKAKATNQLEHKTVGVVYHNSSDDSYPTFL
ncbi:hypothetical protein QUF74_18255 [Candidatus Halobeggiatoa sp. HSG11]|nr:hypothetical protein [Candidatus Halobeggiatoa sp. HSG11]